MTTQKLIISSILTTLLLALTGAPAVAAFDWSSSTDISRDYGATGALPGTHAGDRVGSDNHNFFPRYQNGAPASSGSGTVHRIDLDRSALPTDHPAPNWFRRQDKGKTLEWKAGRTDFWGATCGSAWTKSGGHTGISSTPIPATAWLLGTGIVGLIGIRRRNQKRFQVTGEIEPETPPDS